MATASTAKAKDVKAASAPSPAMSSTDDSAGGALIKPPGTKDAELPEEEVTEEPVSHNAQRMASVHYLSSAIKETLEKDPHLIDHPDVKKFLYEVIAPHNEKMRGMVADKFKETHPDYEPLDGGGEKSEVEKPLEQEEELEEGKKPEEEVPGGKHEDKPPATVPHKEETEEEEEEGTPAEKSWTGPKVKRKSATVNHKSGVPTQGVKGLNMTQRNVLGEVKDYIAACADHADMPHIFRQGHKMCAMKMDDLIGTKEADEAAHADEVPPAEMEEVKSYLRLAGKELVTEVKSHTEKQNEHLAALRAS